MPVDLSPIVRVAARGDGVTADGRHVAFTAPGDRVTEDGAIVPGPHHQSPPCRHFPMCGGCQLQHLDDESHAAFVADRVASALAGQGVETVVRPALVSPPRTRRRAMLQAERRGAQVLIGFHAEGSHDIIDMRECWVLAPALFALVAPLRQLLGGLLGKRARARVHLTLADQGVDVLIEGTQADSLAASEALTEFAGRHRVARVALDSGNGPETRWEPEPVSITFGDVPVPLPHGAFLQATGEGEAALVAAVREATTGATTIADLFAGLGTFALALPARVYAAEGARDAVLALKAGAARAGRPVAAEHRDLFRRPLTGSEASRFGAAVLDPPRAGAREQVAELAGATTPVIAYVSCNPATFARDAAVLIAGGYRLEWVQPVGQFRWSTHVELAARFVRQAG